MEAKPPKVLAGIPVPKFREFRRDPCPAALPEVPLLMSKGIFGRFQPEIPRMDPGFYSRKKKERQEFSQRVKAGNFLGFFSGFSSEGKERKAPNSRIFPCGEAAGIFLGFFFVLFLVFPEGFMGFFPWIPRLWMVLERRLGIVSILRIFSSTFLEFHPGIPKIPSPKFPNFIQEIPEFQSWNSRIPSRIFPKSEAGAAPQVLPFGIPSDSLGEDPMISQENNFGGFKD